VSVFEMGEYEAAGYDVPDFRRAGGDPLQCAPTGAQQCEAAFPDRTAGAVQRVVGLVIGDEAV
jgi:hypothetical protein